MVQKEIRIFRQPHLSKRMVVHHRVYHQKWIHPCRDIRYLPFDKFSVALRCKNYIHHCHRDQRLVRMECNVGIYKRSKQPQVKIIAND